jgi:hypothetical protein
MHAARSSDILRHVTYLEAILRDGPAISELAARDLDRPIPSCPGWVARDVYAHIDETCRNTLTHAGVEVPIQGLEAALQGLDRLPSNHEENALQGLAEECGVHRWDLETAFGKAYEIDGELAALSVDGFFNDAAPGMLRYRGVRAGDGQTIHLHRTDGDDEWLIVLDELPIVTHEHADADVTLTGTASDFVLCLWGRIDPPQVTGDRAVFDNFHAISKH